jgi:hypothetical protein
VTATDSAAVSVEAGALASYAGERYEDRIVFDASRRFLSDVGAIPGDAWGTLPLSADLRRDWRQALDNRLVEARTIRDEMERTSDGLLQIASDYAGTELQVKLSFDLANRDVATYLPSADGYTNSIRSHPGGSGTVVAPRDQHLPDERPQPVIPADNDRLAAMRNEKLPRIVKSGPDTISTDGEHIGLSGPVSVYEAGQELSPCETVDGTWTVRILDGQIRARDPVAQISRRGQIAQLLLAGKVFVVGVVP